jgi:PhoPQ-activated pathogenicity-related protein
MFYKAVLQKVLLYGGSKTWLVYLRRQQPMMLVLNRFHIQVALSQPPYGWSDLVIVSEFHRGYLAGGRALLLCDERDDICRIIANGALNALEMTKVKLQLLQR